MEGRLGRCETGESLWAERIGSGARPSDRAGRPGESIALPPVCAADRPKPERSVEGSGPRRSICLARSLNRCVDRDNGQVAYAAFAGGEGCLGGRMILTD